ncbi:hypothetical protein CMV_019095 [Castanea mollissima]|uniref:Exoribonuclease phosphorolytic domain-containing protein n=1 Tax=Castanea mollissima TaxID=60419 RepID=A0A8J4QNK9_9ROSI|nr:hypothetical protein CMV_019095 [Castanea mollissima]
MRQIRAEIGAVAKADGSAVFEMGNTKVIAAVYGPREVQNRTQQINDQALVRCEYSMANFSTGDRMRKPKGDRFFSCTQTIDRDIFGNSPNRGSLHFDTFDALVSDRYFCPSTPSRWWN